MVNTNVKPEKKEIVTNIKDKIEEASLVVFANYRGLTVSDMNELRVRLKENNASLQVYKNTLMRLALQEMQMDYSAEMLIGPSALVNTESEPTKISKVLVEYAKENEKLVIKGGVLDKRLIDRETINHLAKLPGREALIAKTVGLIKAPLNNLVFALSSPIKGLVNVLDLISEKKQEEL